MQKRIKIKFYSNIVTLQSKNKNKAFKAEVKFTKLKILLNKNKSTVVLGYFDYPISHFTVSAIIKIDLGYL